MNIYRNASEEKIYKILEVHAQKLGYEIVRLQIFPSKNLKMQIMIDRLDTQNVKIDDCEKVSKAFSAILDVEDLIDSKYNLEISSTGINRPLTRKKDYTSNINEKVKVSTYNLINNSKSFIGELLDCNETGIKLFNFESHEVVEISFDSIKDATLLKV